MEAVLADAEAILNICSSVGEVADAAQGIGKYLGVPIVRIDEEMCKCAVRRAAEQSGRIGVLATLPTTLIPTKKTIQRVAREMGKQVILEEGLIDAFGADQETFQKLILGKATELKDKVDIILFCQGSMAYCEEYVHEALGLPVVSSPRFGAKALKRALEEKGVI
jgi:aspartate/glutamate racemase